MAFTYRPDEDTKKKLEAIKKKLKISSNQKAIDRIIHEYPRLEETIKEKSNELLEMEDIIRELSSEIESIKKTIRDKHNADTAYNDLMDDIKNNDTNSPPVPEQIR